MGEKFYFNKLFYYRRKYLKYIQIPPIIYDILFDFFQIPDIPFMTVYKYELSDFDGYYDKDFILTSLVYESLGVNGYLVDLDNRYFLNSGTVSVIFNYQTSGFYIFYLYFNFFKDLLILFIIHLIIFILSKFIYIYNLFKTILNVILICIEIILYYIFSSVYLICLILINLFLFIFKYIILQKFFRSTKFFKITNTFYNILLFLNKILIFPFELIRSLFVINYNFLIKNFCYFIYKYKFFKSYDFIKKSFLYIFYIIFLLLIKLIVIYIIFILLFSYYDGILLFFERVFFIKFSYRSIFVFYAILLFINILILLYPLQLSQILWSFRYYYLIILFILWFMGGNINNIDILFMQYWDFIKLKSNLVFYGPNFYDHFLYYTNYENLWTNIKAIGSAYDFWMHPTVVYYIDFPKNFYNQSKKMYNDFIWSWHFYYGILVQWSTLKEIDQYLSEHYIKPYQEFVTFNKKMIKFYKDLIIDAIPKDKFEFTFLKQYYTLFSLNFLSFDKLYLKKLIYGISGIYYLGGVSLYINMNIYEDENKYSENFLGLIRLTYYRHVFNNLKYDLWGNYVYNPYYFFSFYKRNWFISEKEFFYKVLQINAHGEDVYNKYVRAHNEMTNMKFFGKTSVNRVRPFMFRFTKDHAYFDFYNNYIYNYVMENYNFDPYDQRLMNQNYPHASTLAIYDEIDFHARVNNMPDSPVFFSKFLIPDLGYLGSSHWGTNWKFLQLVDTTTSDSFFFYNNKKPARINK